MRVGFPGGPRLEWYDRNPLSSTIYLVPVAAGPHAATDRAVYTVPTGKKAFIMAAFVSARREVAPSSAGLFRSEARSFTGSLTQTISYGANIGDGGEYAIGQAGMLLASDQLLLRTEDLSTGGVVRYRGTIHVTEFDA